MRLTLVTSPKLDWELSRIVRVQHDGHLKADDDLRLTEVAPQRLKEVQEFCGASGAHLRVREVDMENPNA